MSTVNVYDSDLDQTASSTTDYDLSGEAEIAVLDIIEASIGHQASGQVTVTRIDGNLMFHLPNGQVVNLDR